MIVTDAACLSTSGIYFAFWHITSLSFFSLFCHPDPIIPIAENTLLSFLCGQKSEPNWFIHSYLIPHVIKDICLVFSRHFSKFWAREVIVSPRAEGVDDRDHWWMDHPMLQFTMWPASEFIQWRPAFSRIYKLKGLTSRWLTFTPRAKSYLETGSCL